ncbi:probable transmembrane protein [Vibrio ishigakensis]|uniref:Probable transmembrane protein n=1 Tax=Vibrio ishigakensis TaxID=1481914 RepID=A0A0B8P2I8_9VIBR|nr:YeeE/YedE thiosulfate transporter family protein [Vibrio ishigakensis]GAM57194.1 probable transmembrane protein [Vibrio ishigakensis]
MTLTIPWDSLFGGMLLGVSALLLLLFSGKIAGISGIVSGALKNQAGDRVWRWLFIIGMVLGGILGVVAFSADIPTVYDSSLWVLLLAGFFVGFGTKIGNGCTSGHGICGIGRFSTRSIVATCVFMLVAGITVFVRLHLV